MHLACLAKLLDNIKDMIFSRRGRIPSSERQWSSVMRLYFSVLFALVRHKHLQYENYSFSKTVFVLERHGDIRGQALQSLEQVTANLCVL